MMFTKKRSSSLDLHLETILPVGFCCENLCLDVRKMRAQKHIHTWAIS